MTGEGTSTMQASRPTPTKQAATTSPKQHEDWTKANLEFVHRASWKAGVLGAINVLVQVVAVRMIVLVAVSGGIVLASISLGSPDPWRLGVLAIYALAVVIPVVWLASRR